MKNTLDAYENHLRGYLSRNNFLEAEDESFITTRADEAYELFLDARRRGADVDAAQELAVIYLMHGLNYSYENVIDDIFEKEFANTLPEEGFAFILDDMEDALEYFKELDPVDYEEMMLNENYYLRLELIGLISEHIGRYGL